MPVGRRVGERSPAGLNLMFGDDRFFFNQRFRILRGLRGRGAAASLRENRRSQK
jgi:hypothetical protein